MKQKTAPLQDGSAVIRYHQDETFQAYHTQLVTAHLARMLDGFKPRLSTAPPAQHLKETRWGFLSPSTPSRCEHDACILSRGWFLQVGCHSARPRLYEAAGYVPAEGVIYPKGEIYGT